MTQSDLTARIDERLARPVRPPVYVEIVDPSGRVSYRRWSDHPDVLEALGTQGYTVRRCPQQPDLEGEAHPDRALLVEARAQLAAQVEALVLVQAALTPSAETKAAYSGEFYVEIDYHNPEWDEESETSDEPEFLTDRVMVPWDVIKQIMATIGARTLLGARQ